MVNKMKYMDKKRQHGFGILDALIAFIILAVGGLVLVQFYGDMIAGTGLSKARNEALDLSKQKMAELRNYATKDNFDVLLVDGSESGVQGKNASFNLNWAVVDDAGGADFKTVTVTVAWIDAKLDSNGAEVERSVSMDSIIFFADPALTSNIYSKQIGASLGGKLLAPWVAGVEGEDPSTLEQDALESQPDPEDLVLGTGDTATTVTVETITYDGGNVEIKADGIVVLTAYGGIIHKIQGEIGVTPAANSIILSDIIGNPNNAAELLSVLASPPSVCFFPICTDPLQEGLSPANDCKFFNPNLVDNPQHPDGQLFETAHYVCYVPGDCTDGGVGCPDVDLVATSLNGGWYGRVGNLSIFLNPDDAVCTADTVVSGGDDLNLTPSREYVTKRFGEANALVGFEGINTPYECQSFLIDRKQNGMDCETIFADYYSTILPEESIIRALHGNSDKNTAQGNDSSDCLSSPSL